MQDVDVLILDSHYEQEEIKRMLAGKNPGFYLVDAKTAGADWKVLWYHLRGRGSTRRPGAIKIDVLLPGIMEIPSFDPRWIERDNSRRLPTAPLSLVLLHKVRGWSERIKSVQDHHYQRHKQDAHDVTTLAPLASQMGVTIHDGVLPNEFTESANGWVNDFIAAYPELRTQYHWSKIGFRTGVQDPLPLAIT
jgi:hypothetical protein